MQCRYRTIKTSSYKRHINKCKYISVQLIEGKQIVYGEGSAVIEKLVEDGYLPQKALEFRQEDFATFDIETLEKRRQVR